VRALFCRVHPVYAVAPTSLELVTAGPAAEPVPERLKGFPVAEVAALQGNRKIKLHSTPIAMPSEMVSELGERLWDASEPHGYLGAPPALRVVLGPIGPFAGRGYRDGLFIEAIPLTTLTVPPETFYLPADVPPDAGPGTMVRIVAREYLVDDLDATLATLAHDLRWRPAAVVDEPGCRRAVMTFRSPRSATLELVQPTAPGRVADAYEQLGAGPWTIRIAVVDVPAKAADLDARGTPFTLEDGRLRPDPATTLHVPIEFVAA